MEQQKLQLKRISALYVVSRMIIFFLVISILVTFFYSPVKDRLDLRKLNAKYSAEVAEINVELANKKKEVADLEVHSQELQAQIDIQSKTIKEFNDSLVANLDTLNSFKEKYSAALNFSSTQDFGLNELLFTYEVCKEYSVPIEIMLAIFEKESGFYSLAKNKTSTATGYGQLIDSTAKSIYEKFLNLGTYDMSRHRELCCDKELNIRLACRLMKYNIDSYKTNWKAVERYYGHSDQSLCYSYASDINKRMSKYGSSLK